MWMGEHDAAITQLTRALRLSPLDADTCRLEGAIAGALLFQDKYAEALSWATKGLARKNNHHTIMFAVVANALVGNIEEARKILAQFRTLVPWMRISHFEDTFTLRRPQDMARWIEGFRLAGLPE